MRCPCDPEQALSHILVQDKVLCWPDVFVDGGGGDPPADQTGGSLSNILVQDSAASYRALLRSDHCSQVSRVVTYTIKKTEQQAYLYCFEVLKGFE